MFAYHCTLDQKGKILILQSTIIVSAYLDDCIMGFTFEYLGGFEVIIKNNFGKNSWDQMDTFDEKKTRGKKSRLSVPLKKRLVSFTREAQEDRFSIQ